MIINSNIAQRSVKIVRASDRQSISSILSTAASIVDIHWRDMEIDEAATPFLLSTDTISSDITNKIGTPFAGNVASLTGNKWLSGARLVAEGFSALQGNDAAWNPWFTEIKAWKGTEVKSIKLSFDFKLGQYGLWNARREVVLPALALVVPALPLMQHSAFAVGPFPATVALIGQFASRLLSELGGDAGESFSVGSSLTSALYDAVSASVYHVSVGNVFSLMHAVPSEVSFDLATDLDTEGFPVAAKVSVVYQGIVPPALNYGENVPIGLRFGSATPSKGHARAERPR